MDSVIGLIVAPMFMYITGDNFDISLGIGVMGERKHVENQISNPTGHINFTGYYGNGWKAEFAHTSDLVATDDDLGINTITIYKTFRIK